MERVAHFHSLSQFKMEIFPWFFSGHFCNCTHAVGVFNPDTAEEELFLVRCQPGLNGESFMGSSARGLVLFLVTNSSFNSFGVLCTEQRRSWLAVCLSACL